MSVQRVKEYKSRGYTDAQIIKLLELKSDEELCRGGYSHVEIEKIKALKLRGHSITTWHSFTCECVINYSHPVPDSESLHTFFSVVKKCSLHAFLEDEECYKTVRINNSA